MNKRTKWGKRSLTIALTLLMCFVAVFSNSNTLEVKASGSGTIYYNFVEIIEPSQFAIGTKYLFLHGVHYTAADAVVELPNGSAALTVVDKLTTQGDKNTGDGSHTGYYFDGGVTDDSANNMWQVAVAVDSNLRSDQFDTCDTGSIGYTERSGITAWYYGCHAGGAKNKGPFYAYSFSSATYTDADISVVKSDSWTDPAVGETKTVGTSDIKVVINIGGVSVDVDTYTIETSNNTVDTNGDNSITVTCGGVTKENIALLSREATPNGTLNSNTINGLIPNGTYKIACNGTSIDVTSDASGNIDVATYVGKTIVLSKASTGSGILDSRGQQFTIPTVPVPDTTPATPEPQADPNAPNSSPTTVVPGTISSEVNTNELVTVEGSSAESGVTGAQLDDYVDVIQDIALNLNEKARYNAGENINFYLEVTDISESLDATEKSLLDELAQDYTPMCYLNIEFFKQIGNDPRISVEQLENGKIRVSLAMSDKMAEAGLNGSDFLLMAHHEGDATAEQVEATFDYVNKLIIFETGRFSTYAIYEKEATLETTSDQVLMDDVPHTGEYSIISYLFFAMIASSMLFIVSKRKIHK